jgi:hypothetical protein
MDTGGIGPTPSRGVFPLQSPDDGTALLTPRRLQQWTIGFLLLGVLARCVRYFLRFPLWEDECFLCANFIDRGYRGMLAPLHYHQVAPILFLWLELTVVKLFGYTEMTLRLVPFLAGIGSLVLFYRLARVSLTGVPRLFAVALFSITYGMIRYSAEAKPYGIDLFVSLVLVNLMVNWLRRPESNRWLWVLVASIPVALGLSYGAVMLGGGLSVTMAWFIWRQRRWQCVVPWLTFSVALLGTFLAVYFLCIRVQAAHELGKMRDFWGEHFPPLISLREFAWWLLYVHTGDILAYPGGGTPFQSSAATVCWLAGLAALARRRFGTMLVLCLAPQGVTFVAALLKRYPYGGHIRLSLYLAPFMCMVIGYGAAALLAWLARRGRNATAVATGFLAVLVVVGAVCILRDLAGPYKNVSDQRARGFAQWFWFSESQKSEVACLTSDLGVILSPDQFSELNFSAQYLCNQRIYSPRHAARRPVAWDQVSAGHPLVCVFFRSALMRFDDAKYQAWLHDMLRKYDLVGRDSLPSLRSTKSGVVCDFDSIEVFRFVPRASPRPGSTFLSQGPGPKPAAQAP